MARKPPQWLVIAGKEDTLLVNNQQESPSAKWVRENPDKAKASYENHRKRKRANTKPRPGLMELVIPITEQYRVLYPEHNNILMVRKPKILTKMYGITIDNFYQMIHDQKNKCAICRQPFTETPHIDHCHKTGKIRGLLCRHCNYGLGNFKDKKQNLTNALKYLEKPDICWRYE